jgi:hypothetical protein
MCSLHPLLEGQDFGCLVLNNVGNLLIEILIYVLAKLVIQLLICSQRKSQKDSGKKTKFANFLSKANGFLSRAFFIEFMIALHMDLNMASSINLRNFWVLPFPLFAGSMIALVVIVAYGYLIRKLLSNSIRLERKLQRLKKITNETETHSRNRPLAKKDSPSSKEKDIQRKLDPICEVLKKEIEEDQYGFLKENRHEDSTFIGGIINEIILCRDYIVAINILLFLEYPVLQMLPSIGLFLGVFYLLLKNKAYNSKLMYYTVLLNESSYTVFFFLYFVFHLVQDSMTEKSRY